MKKYLTIILFLFASCSFAEIRPPAVAGAFYPADKEELQYQVRKLLQNVPSPEVKGDIISLVVPHAGYLYSGQVAAYAYKQLEGKSFDTVVLLGASHKFSFDQIVLPAYEYFETPLGKVPIDQDLVARLRKIDDKIVIDNTPHREEHSLEVQLPFLQMTLKDGFKVVPVLFGSVSLSNCQALAYALSFLIEDNTLIIASTDWSHYYPYDTALKLDHKGIDAVVKDDLREYIRSLAEGESEACGSPAVITAMLVAPAMGANKIELLKYANSGDVTGDRSKVVGYAAIAYFRQETRLTEMEKRELLRNARKTIERRLSGKNYLEYKVPEGTLTSNRGAFVTLTKDGKLKGCIGYIQPVKPLHRAVQEMAIEAAENDPRFPPVGKDELKDIKIEISVLSRLKKVKDISEIEIGRDGLYIIKNGKSGLLLPQVAVEWGWDRDRLLDEVCIKAGLREGEWRSKDAVLYRFTADIFHER